VDDHAWPGQFAAGRSSGATALAAQAPHSTRVAASTLSTGRASTSSKINSDLVDTRTAANVPQSGQPGGTAHIEGETLRTPPCAAGA
jgi:hypothetical protein